ncbi:hypothetical protein EYF80_026244 [Liparis tanakae]|uniref:Uncharacterized protein n=1 Tax=Liparis tanakae TaxID=230148 RepID=A0A4Z2HFD2_9TELE|nr:hypothetical protein EYF80_026244 [Liparis tanakae]
MAPPSLTPDPCSDPSLNLNLPSDSDDISISFPVSSTPLTRPSREEAEGTRRRKKKKKQGGRGKSSSSSSLYMEEEEKEEEEEANTTVYRLETLQEYFLCHFANCKARNNPPF